MTVLKHSFIILFISVIRIKSELEKSEPSEQIVTNNIITITTDSNNVVTNFFNGDDDSSTSTIIPDIIDENEENSTTNGEILSTTKSVKNVTVKEVDYIIGNFGGYYFKDNNTVKYFVHGYYQKPVGDYYENYNHKLKDRSTLGYYLGYAMKKMNRNEYFRHNNFTHFNIHHYYYSNNVMKPNQYIKSNQLITCAFNTSRFCPQNTEAICLTNTTVWCASKMTYVNNCEYNIDIQCVLTRIPCVKSDDENCNRLTELVELPCISKIIILDSDEDRKGLTFNNVAGTFILAPVLPVSERTYCVTIVAEPSTD